MITRLFLSQSMNEDVKIAIDFDLFILSRGALCC